MFEPVAHPTTFIAYLSLNARALLWGPSNLLRLRSEIRIFNSDRYNTYHTIYEWNFYATDNH